MKFFGYTKIQGSLQSALHESTSHAGSAYIGGGTNLIDLMKEAIVSPDHLVDVSELSPPELQEQSDGSTMISAFMRNSSLAAHHLIRKKYPILSRALLSGASPQLRNMATVGGNLLQRTRCWYFYDIKSNCNKRIPGSGCDAINGINRMNAILGGSQDCIAVHPSDMCVALTCLDARIHTIGSSGNRVIPISEFYRLPGSTPHLETALEPHELITGVELPAQGFHKHWTYLKIRDRASYAFALVSVALGMEIENGKITTCRMALGGVGTIPWRTPAAENHIVGKPPDQQTFRQAASIALKDAKGYGHNDFKIELAKRAIVRALKIVGSTS